MLRRSCSFGFVGPSPPHAPPVHRWGGCWRGPTHSLDSELWVVAGLVSSPAMKVILKDHIVVHRKRARFELVLILGLWRDLSSKNLWVHT